MTDAVIIAEGTIVGRRTGEYENQPFGSVQMQSREKESIKMIEINLADGFEITRYPIGTKMKIPVRIGASKDGRRIYYREIPAAEAVSGEPAKSASEAARRQPVTA